MIKALLVGTNVCRLIQVLARTGERVLDFRVAASVREAHDLLQNDRSIKLVISDSTLPDGTGPELVSQLRIIESTRHIPVVIASCVDTTPGHEALPDDGPVNAANSINENEACSQTNAQAAGGTSQSVLVVDDERVILNLLDDILRIEGYECLTASDADQAIKVLGERRIDAVVSDVVMPGKSGIDLLMELKSKEPDLPVIIISGHPGKYTMKDIWRAGADGYFKKPFQCRELLNTLREVLKSHPQSPGGPHRSSESGAALSLGSE